MAPEEKEVTIVLEPWQKRQLNAYIPSQKIPGKDFGRIVVRPGKGGCLASYKVLVDLKRGFEIFLTDAQIASVRDVLGGAAEVISVTVSSKAVKNEAISLIA